MENIRELKSRLDSHDMYGMITAMPSHLEEGLELGLRVNLQSLEKAAFHAVVIAGMGGSAIAGDIIRSYLVGQIEVPLYVCRHYRLPNFVNKRTLVICSSYSGETEETLSAYDDALLRGANVIAIATGGKLAEKAALNEIPLIRITGGLPPRAALGYSVSSLLVILWRLGLCGDQCDNLRHAASAMKRWAVECAPENENNPALKLAREISGSIPIIYSGQDRLDAVATRFKGQLGENAKVLAFANVFPELSHNEIVGWDMFDDLGNKPSVVILRDSQDHKRIKARMDIVAQYLAERGVKVINLESRGGSDLEKILYLVQLLDFASYYLALLGGVDPFPIPAITFLKNRLSEIR